MENKLPIKDENLNVVKYRHRESSNIYNSQPDNSGQYIREINVEAYKNFLSKPTDVEFDEVRNIIEIVKRIKAYWGKVSEYGINVVPFSCAVSKLASGDTGVLMIAEKVTPAISPDNNKRTDSKLYMLRNFKDYYDRPDDGCKFWSDVDVDGQFVYGRLPGDIKDKWYLVDIDPKFSWKGRASACYATLCYRLLS